MIARLKLKAPRHVKPHPYPRWSTNGLVVSGRKVPARHLVTMIPVIAEAENSPQASTIYAWSGMIVKSNEESSRPADTRRNGTGS
jgi:hypothetical protein